MNEQIAILIIDDEQTVRDSLMKRFSENGYSVGTAENPSEAFRQLQIQEWHIIFLNIKMPGLDRMEFQRHVRSIDSSPIIIFIADHASVDTTIQALNMGGFDYITKPINPDYLSHVLSHAIKFRTLQSEIIKLKERVAAYLHTDELIGDSIKMRNVAEMVQSIARTDSPVLISGEHGTGKELIARTIHANSDRRNFPIEVINCRELTEAALVVELFGEEHYEANERQRMRIGKLEFADGGTIVLNEIGNIGMELQSTLLSIIETKQFTRIGGKRVIDSDVRIICTTSNEIERAVLDGSFREDLYHRLNISPIILPPLRDRKSDISLLTKYFVAKYAQEIGKPMIAVAPDAMDILVNYQWPGNIQELKNAIERAIIAGTPPVIKSDDFPFAIASKKSVPVISSSLANVERIHIINTLELNRWNISRSAAILQIDRVTLYNKIQKYGLKRPR
jgi:DNA-binding NtrC family response regulator